MPGLFDIRSVSLRWVVKTFFLCLRLSCLRLHCLCLHLCLSLLLCRRRLSVGRLRLRFVCAGVIRIHSTCLCFSQCLPLPPSFCFCFCRLSVGRLWLRFVCAGVIRIHSTCLCFSQCLPPSLSSWLFGPALRRRLCCRALENALPTTTLAFGPTWTNKSNGLTSCHIHIIHILFLESCWCLINILQCSSIQFNRFYYHMPRFFFWSFLSSSESSSWHSSRFATSWSGVSCRAVVAGSYNELETGTKKNNTTQFNTIQITIRLQQTRTMINGGLCRVAINKNPSCWRKKKYLCQCQCQPLSWCMDSGSTTSGEPSLARAKRSWPSGGSSKKGLGSSSAPFRAFFLARLGVVEAAFTAAAAFTFYLTVKRTTTTTTWTGLDGLKFKLLFRFYHQFSRAKQDRMTKTIGANTHPTLTPAQPVCMAWGVGTVGARFVCFFVLWPEAAGLESLGAIANQAELWTIII